MVDNQRVCRLEAKTRFRFSSEGGRGVENEFRGREVRGRYPLSLIT